MPYGSLSVGCEEHLDPAGTGSFYNEGEADIVVQHVSSLIFSGKMLITRAYKLTANVFQHFHCYQIELKFVFVISQTLHVLYKMYFRTLFSLLHHMVML
jgi:hypothetical protein